MSTFELMHCFGLLILCLTKTYGVLKKIDDPPTSQNITLPLNEVSGFHCLLRWDIMQSAGGYH
jgi:hypothetical protein